MYSNELALSWELYLFCRPFVVALPFVCLALHYIGYKRSKRTKNS